MDTAHEHSAVKRWGLLDTQDNVWIGNDTGPITFHDYAIARVAAQMCDVMLAQQPGRTRAVLFDGRNLRLRDCQKTAMSPEEALRRMESGEAI